jgi:outer membrane receptor for ferrienterochelin and colicins
VATRLVHCQTRLAGALVLLAGFSTIALAQDAKPPEDLPAELSQLSLEELVELKMDSVYGASRYAQKVNEAPSSVTIITADEIDKYGYRTLADILRSVRGFYVTYDRNYSYLGVRGFSRPGDYNVRVLLLVDGHRLNDSIFGGALIGTEFPLDIDLIDRVEIIRGPSSSLYGTSAFLGVINVITKRAESLKGMNVSGGLSSFDTLKGRFTYGNKLANGVGLLLSGSSYDSDGRQRLFFKEFDSPATNNGIAEHADLDEFTKVLGKLTIGRFTLQGLYGSRDKSIPTASFGTVFNDARSRTVEMQGYLDAQYERGVGKGWELGSRLYYDHYGYDGDYVFDYSETDQPLLVINRDRARGNWWGAEIKLTRKIGRRHTLAVGSEYRDNFRQDQINYDERPFVEYLDDQRHSRNGALFIQDEITLGESVIVNVGVRHDHYDSFGGTTNPRLGLIYNPTKETTLKLLYGEAFRAPTAYELFWRQNEVTKANPLLQPETNKTAELVVEHYLANNVRLSATGFYYRIRELITQGTDPVDGLLVYNNVEAIRARGLELEAEGKWRGGLQSRISYVLQGTWNDHTEQSLTNSPKHLAQANFIAPLKGKAAFAGVDFQYVGKRRTLAGGEVGDVFMANVTVLTERLRKGMELSATVYNLFDNEYADPGSEEHRQDAIIQNGRSFGVKLTYSFAGRR